MGEGPISWLAIRDWANEYGLEGDQRLDLFHHVQALDKVYLDFQAKKRKAAIAAQAAAAQQNKGSNG